MDTVAEMKPMIYVSSHELPEIKKWKVGETYEVIVKMKMKGMHQRDNSSHSADFEIEGIMYPGTSEDDLADITNNSEWNKKAGELKRKVFSA